MVSKKQNLPPPKQQEESSEEEIEEEEEEEEEIEEEEEEGHQEKPQASSSSGGEDDEEDETDSNEDDEQSISKRIQPASQHVKKSSTPPPAAVVQNSVSEEEETDSEGEEEEEEAELNNAEPESLRSPTASDFTVRPITVPANAKGSKPNPKRPLEASKDDGKGSGNGKKAKTVEENDKKGKGASAGRIWSDENEIVVLQGMIDYQKRKGPFRPIDIGVFYEFIKEKLWDGVTKNQVADKIKRVKCKYSLNIKKCKNGQDPPFSKPHEKKAFDLSKQIWGAESNGIEDKAKIKGDDGKGKRGGNSGSENKRIEDNAKVKSDNPKGKKGDNASSALIPLMDVDEDEKQNVKMDDLKDDEEEDFLSKFPTLSKSFDAEMGFLKENLHLIGNHKAKELEEKWKQLQLEEMDVLAKRFNMMSEQIKMVLDAMKKR